jgi:hypothetical protein
MRIIIEECNPWTGNAYINQPVEGGHIRWTGAQLFFNWRIILNENALILSCCWSPSGYLMLFNIVLESGRFRWFIFWLTELQHGDFPLRYLDIQCLPSRLMQCLASHGETRPLFLQLGSSHSRETSAPMV